MHFYLNMHFILSHWQFEGRAGVRPLLRHPAKIFLHMLPFPSLFLFCPLKQSHCCFKLLFCYFYLRVLDRCWSNPAVLWWRAPDSWVTFRACPTWHDHAAHTDRIAIYLITFSPAVLYIFRKLYVSGGIWLPHSFHSRYFPTCTSYVLSLKSLRAKKVCCSQGLLHALSNWTAVLVQKNDFS